MPAFIFFCAVFIGPGSGIFNRFTGNRFSISVLLLFAGVFALPGLPHGALLITKKAGTAEYQNNPDSFHGTNI
jgi:hypothetical protein